MTTDLSKVPINRWVKILHPLKWNTNRFSIEIHFEFWFFFILLAGNAPNHHRIPDLAFSAELIDPPSIGMTILRFAAYTPIGWKGNVFAGKLSLRWEISDPVIHADVTEIGQIKVPIFRMMLSSAICYCIIRNDRVIPCAKFPERSTVFPAVRNRWNCYENG